MQLLIDFFHQLKTWDTPSKSALLLAVIGLLMSLAIALFVPDLRQLALFGVFGFVIVSQIIIMWGNRGMITPYAKAQRLYQSGKFSEAQVILETEIQNQSAPNMRELLLLGNVYRNLGLLDQSEDAIQRVLTMQPDAHLPLYSLAKTKMAEGEYEEAVRFFKQALDRGAPDFIQFDLGYALYLAGLHQEAIPLLSRVVQFSSDPPHQLMSRHILNRLEHDDFDLSLYIDGGIGFWESEAKRFQTTPYGAAIIRDLQTMNP